MEIEAKIAISDDAARTLRALVIQLGGTLRFSRREVNIFYDARTSRLQKRGEVLRLRHETYQYDRSWKFGEDNDCEIITMTFKGRRVKGRMKTRPEYETRVHNFVAANNIISALGYTETFRFPKYRESFYLGDCLVEFDQLPLIGNFVEVEGATESKIAKVLKQLRVNGAKIIVEGYGSLLRKYLKTMGLSREALVLQ